MKIATVLLRINVEQFFNNQTIIGNTLIILITFSKDAGGPRRRSWD